MENIFPNLQMLFSMFPMIMMMMATRSEQSQCQSRSSEKYFYKTCVHILLFLTRVSSKL